jgi:hypothetical protein
LRRSPPWRRCLGNVGAWVGCDVFVTLAALWRVAKFGVGVAQLWSAFFWCPAAIGMVANGGTTPSPVRGGRGSPCVSNMVRVAKETAFFTDAITLTRWTQRSPPSVLLLYIDLRLVQDVLSMAWRLG